MGEFRSEGRRRSSGGFGRSRENFGGRSGGSRGFGRGRDERRNSGFRRDSGPREMYDVVCTKCGLECQVPFKPTGNKPVLCNDCFKQKEGGKRSDYSRSEKPQSRPSSDQLNQIDAKLDKIIKILQELELDSGNEEDKKESEETEEEN